MSYLKARGDEPNTLLLDQGDTWQETLYSAYNQGHLITDVMNYVQFDARTIGNHDFDWGVKVLQDNTERDYNGYSTPVLGANIFEYDNDLKTITSRQCSELGTTSVTYTLENGLKVGIVGVIGEDQYTSISSNIVKDVAFKDHISVIKSEATKLRENGCDVVICSAHTGQDSLTGNNLSNYVDLVLCGHTHRDEHTTEGNLFYGQYGCDGQKFGHVTLTYDYGQKKVVSTSSDTLDRYDISTSIDPQIQAICDPYFAEVQEVASIKYLKNKTQYFSRSAMARLMCEAMYEQAVVEGYDVYGAMCNEARDYISANRQWTYEDIFDCFPFNNEVLIMDVKGDELQNELAWNPLYRAPAHISDPVPLDTGSTRIAVIDYVGYHQNTARSYNYFPYGALHVVGTLSVNYRDCLINYLLRHNYDTGGTLDASRYADGTSASEFSTSLNYI